MPLDNETINNLLEKQKRRDTLSQNRKDAPEGFKFCTRCGELKKIEQFYKHGKVRVDTGEIGRHTECSECKRERDFIRDYGITISDYDEMFEIQNGLCAICMSPPSDRRRLAVDHNHETGKVRGLLCPPCNIALGWHEKYRDSFDLYLLLTEG